jgi:hypothetical protein
MFHEYRLPEVKQKSVALIQSSFTPSFMKFFYWETAMDQYNVEKVVSEGSFAFLASDLLETSIYIIKRISMHYNRRNARQGRSFKDYRTRNHYF